MKVSFRRLASSLALAGLAGLAGIGTVACSAGPGADPGGVSEAPAKKIDATLLASMPAGRNLVLDMTRPDVAYDIDDSAGPIDFSRVELHLAPGQDVSMTDWLARTAADGRDDVARPPGHFVVRPVSSVHLSPEALQPDQPPVCVDFCKWFCAAPGACSPVCWEVCK